MTITLTVVLVEWSVLAMSSDNNQQYQVTIVTIICIKGDNITMVSLLSGQISDASRYIE